MLYRHVGNVMKGVFAIVFVITVVAAGYALQEESGICLPERHAAEQENAIHCHCLDMGGYQYCKDGLWQYKDWVQEGAKTPRCDMSCKEENCKCCKFEDDRQKRQHRRAKVKITIPYDSLS